MTAVGHKSPALYLAELRARSDLVEIPPLLKLGLRNFLVMAVRRPGA